MTIAATLGFLKFLVPFILGWFSKHQVQALSDAQAESEAAENKASDPAQNNDVTDLDDI